jgi:hypothetical protein
MEVFEVLEFRGGVGSVVGGVVGGRIIKAFYLVMHRCSFFGGVSSCGGPHFFYFFRGFSVIFGIGNGVVPFLFVSHHCGDDFLGVKMFEVLMNPCCH